MRSSAVEKVRRKGRKEENGVTLNQRQDAGEVAVAGDV
jgi:hypothetical protein